MTNDDDKDLIESARSSKVSQVLHEDPLHLRDARKRIGEGKSKEGKLLEDEKSIQDAIESFGGTLEGRLKDTAVIGRDQKVSLGYSTATVSSTTVEKKEGKPALHERSLVVKGSAANGTADQPRFVINETQIGDLDSKGVGSIGTLTDTTVFDRNGKPAHRYTTSVSYRPERSVATTEITYEEQGIEVKRWASREIDDRYKPRSAPETISNEAMKQEYEAKLKGLIDKGPKDKNTTPVIPREPQEEGKGMGSR